MNEQYKSTGGIITGIILIFCGVIMVPIAIGMLFSFPDTIWWIGLILLGSSSTLIYSGIKGMRKTNKETEYSENFLKDIQKEAHKKLLSVPVKTVADAPMVLAHWKYTAEEWEKFFRKEQSSLGAESFGITIGISVLGTILLVYAENASWLLAFTISAAIAILFSTLKYILKKNSISLKSGQQAEVIIGLDTVVINGKLQVLRDENKWLGEIEIIEKTPPAFLEFTYYWKTRSGLTNDEVRIPVPPGKMKEAEEVLLKLKLYHKLVKIG